MEHVHACHAKWLCRTLRALFQAATVDIARDPAEIILPDATDLLGGVGPPRQRPDPMWLPLAANALKVRNPLHAPPADPPLHRLIHAHRSARGDAAAKSDSCQPRRSLSQPGGSPLLAPLRLPVSCAAGLSRPEPSLGGHSVGKPPAVCEHHSVRELLTLSGGNAKPIACSRPLLVKT
jgi:hypothetical protein